jgi:hypothetical protein
VFGKEVSSNETVIGTATVSPGARHRNCFSRRNLNRQTILRKRYLRRVAFGRKAQQGERKQRQYKQLPHTLVKAFSFIVIMTHLD